MKEEIQKYLNHPITISMHSLCVVKGNKNALHDIYYNIDIWVSEARALWHLDRERFHKLGLGPDIFFYEETMIQLKDRIKKILKNIPEKS